APAPYQERLAIGKSLTISGAGADATILDGGHPFTTGTTVIISSTPGISVTLAGLRIQGGKSPGGLFAAGGLATGVSTTVTLSGVDIAGNQSSGRAAGVFNRGTLLLNGSSVRDNVASGNGAGLYNEAPNIFNPAGG